MTDPPSNQPTSPQPTEGSPVSQEGEAGWLTLCRVDELEPDRGRFVNAGERSLAVFRVTGGADDQTPAEARLGDDAVRVIDDFCPHAGASLAGGFIDQGCVICPWHGWAFDAATGVCPDNPAIVAPTFPVRLRDGRVQVQLPSKAHSA